MYNNYIHKWIDINIHKWDINIHKWGPSIDNYIILDPIYGYLCLYLYSYGIPLNIYYIMVYIYLL